MAQALEKFSELLSRGNFSMAEACLLIAQDAYPGLDVPHYLSSIDTLAKKVKKVWIGDGPTPSVSHQSDTLVIVSSMTIGARPRRRTWSTVRSRPSSRSRFVSRTSTTR